MALIHFLKRSMCLSRVRFIERFDTTEDILSSLKEWTNLSMNQKCEIDRLNDPLGIVKKLIEAVL